MKQLLSTLGLAPARFQPCPAGGPDPLEAIRQAMLEALGWPVPRGCEGLVLRIRHGIGAERLWFLRGELMQALACMHGEAAAMERLAGISSMFEGVLPSGLVARHRSR